MARHLHDVREEAATEAVAESEAGSAEKALSEQIDELQKSSDSGADHVRNLYIAFLAFAAYLAVTIGGTTDEQLLRSGPVRLPILNVDLPLFAFFWIAPALFVLFHYNLLSQLCLLAEKLRGLDQAIKTLADPDQQTRRRLRLNMFVFSHMLIGRQQPPLSWFLKAMAWTTFALLPLVVLLLAQIRFLPYHHDVITWAHRGLIAADLALLWLLWTSAIDPTGRRYRRLQAYTRWLSRTLMKNRLGGTRTVRPQGVKLTLQLLYGSGRSDRSSRFPMLRIATVVAAILALFISVIPGEFPLAWPIDTVIGPSNSLVGVSRNLVVRESNLVDAWPTSGQIEQFGEDLAWRNFGKPISLRGRDLRYGDFFQTIFTRADLRGVNLLGARLAETTFLGADLSCIENLGRDGGRGCTDLRAAELAGANLTGANLFSVNLQDAKLGSTDLHGADLSLANLKDADLRSAILQSAKLDEADFRRAWLSNANLRGASVFGANLQGALLVAADLSGVFLNSVLLQGADLTSANLECADLTQANLQGALLGTVRMQGAILPLANLQGANFHNPLSGTAANPSPPSRRRHAPWPPDVAGESIVGDSWSSDLRGAHLGGAKLQGADLQGVNLQGANLGSASLWRATIGNSTGRDRLWDLVDLWDADLSSIKDVDSLIAEAASEIADQSTRARVVEALEASLRDDDRPAIPAWESKPNVMFDANSNLAQALGWGEPSMTGEEYDERVADLLGDLACDERGIPDLALAGARNWITRPLPLD